VFVVRIKATWEREVELKKYKHLDFIVFWKKKHELMQLKTLCYDICETAEMAFVTCESSCEEWLLASNGTWE